MPAPRHSVAVPQIMAGRDRVRPHPRKTHTGRPTRRTTPASPFFSSSPFLLPFSFPRRGARRGGGAEKGRACSVGGAGPWPGVPRGAPCRNVYFGRPPHENSRSRRRVCAAGPARPSPSRLGGRRRRPRLPLPGCRCTRFGACTRFPPRHALRRVVL